MTVHESFQSFLFETEAQKSDSSPPQEYDRLLLRIIQRSREVLRFDRFLKEQTSWLTAPASTRFHLARPGGLVRHSIHVVQTLLRLRDLLAPDLSEESCILVGLFHDVGKVGMPGKPYYLPNPNQTHSRNTGVRYIVSKELAFMDTASRSLFLLAQHLPLTEEEAQAIRYHDGQYIDENRGAAHRETRLTLLLQHADNWSSEAIERGQ